MQRHTRQKHTSLQLKVRSGLKAGYYLGITLGVGPGSGPQNDIAVRSAPTA